MKLYQSYIDQKQYQHAISYLIASGMPQSKAYWVDLSHHVQDQPDLYWFCCVHSGTLPSHGNLSSKTYLEIYNQLPEVPSLLEQYNELTKEEQNEWAITEPSPLWKEGSWKIPILLFENNMAPLLSWIERLEKNTLEAIFVKQLITHLSKNEHFEYFCALYLWKKTCHKLQPTLLSNLGTWALKYGINKEYPLSSKSIFFAQISSNEKIRLADKLHVHLYDIEDHAFVQEIESIIIENNRSSVQLETPQSLYGILPIIDDLGTQATDSLVEYLLNHISEHPADIWAKATLVYIASSANDISSEHYEAVRTIRKQLIEHLPNDPYIQCFDEDKHSTQTFSNVFPSKESIGARAFLQPENKQAQQMLDFYASQCTPEAMYNRFCIQQKRRESTNNDTSPSVLNIIIITVIVFAICIWLLGSVLSQLL